MMSRIEDASDDIGRRGLVLATMARLKQVCNHPAHLLGDGSRLAGRSGKLARLEEICEEIVAEGDRALCFTQYAEFGRMLQPYLAARTGCQVLFLHGGTTKKQRDAMVARFQEADEPLLFLLSLKAGGTGLNLTAANHVIHIDRWWNPAVEDQATDRAFRIGQRRDVQVRKFVCVGTLEERIDAMIEQKKALAEQIVGTGESWLTELSTAALREVLALSPEAVSSEPLSFPGPNTRRGPIAVEGGIKAKSKRGAIGEQWWSRRFIAVLESFGPMSRPAAARAQLRAARPGLRVLAGRGEGRRAGPGLAPAAVQGDARGAAADRRAVADGRVAAGRPGAVPRPAAGGRDARRDRAGLRGRGHAAVPRVRARPDDGLQLPGLGRTRASTWRRSATCWPRRSTTTRSRCSPGAARAATTCSPRCAASDGAAGSGTAGRCRRAGPAGLTTSAAPPSRCCRT